MPDIYPLVEKFVIDAFTKAGKHSSIRHFQRTVYWVEQLKPDVDEALQCAAVAHDIERAFRAKDYNKVLESPAGYTDAEHMKYHQEKGAEILCDFLISRGVDQYFIQRVRNLISKHEVGGDGDQDILKDADSVSFFENNIEYFLSGVAKVGKEKIRAKFQWMFDRITSEKARDIARPWYEEAMKKLNTQT